MKVASVLLGCSNISLSRQTVWLAGTTAFVARSGSADDMAHYWLKQKSNWSENGAERKGEKSRCIGGAPAKAVGRRTQVIK